MYHDNIKFLGFMTLIGWWSNVIWFLLMLLVKSIDEKKIYGKGGNLKEEDWALTLGIMSKNDFKAFVIDVPH